MCPNTSSNGLNPETPGETSVPQTAISGFPYPNLSLIRNSRHSSRALKSGAIFQELLDFGDGARMIYTVRFQTRALLLGKYQT